MNFLEVPLLCDCYEFVLISISWCNVRVNWKFVDRILQVECLGTLLLSLTWYVWHIELLLELKACVESLSRNGLMLRNCNGIVYLNVYRFVLNVIWKVWMFGFMLICEWDNVFALNESYWGCINRMFIYGNSLWFMWA